MSLISGELPQLERHRLLPHYSSDSRKSVHFIDITNITT